MGAIEILKDQKIGETVAIYCLLLVIIILLARWLYKGGRLIKTNFRRDRDLHRRPSMARLDLIYILEMRR